MITYALIDPRNGKIRYVGTTQRPAARLMQHMSDACYDPDMGPPQESWKGGWLAALKMARLKPVMVKLADGDFERTIYKAFKANGALLFNKAAPPRRLFLTDQRQLGEDGMTHTPGAWRQVSGTFDDGKCFGIAGVNQLSGQTGPVVCIISPADRVNEEDVFNANLIAAAPELLEALENARVQLALLGGPDDVVNNAILYLADKAIAKARNTPALHVEVL